MLNVGSPGLQAVASTSSSIRDGNPSTTWAGYVQPTSKSVTTISASWTVPAVRCKLTPNAHSNAWVGVGGALRDDKWPFPQAGTDSDCKNGLQSYDYWCSYGSFRTNHSVRAGDKVTVTIWEASHKWRCLVDDETANESSSAALDYHYTGETTHADFIVERVGGENETLADFGSVKFKDMAMAPSSRFDNPKDRSVMVASQQRDAKVLAVASLDPLVVHYVARPSAPAQSPTTTTVPALSWGPPASFDSGGEVTSVSCPSTSYCVAVDGNGNIMSYNGVAWSTAQTSDDQLNSVSCASDSFCAAVGYDDAGGNVFRYNDGAWSSPESLDAGYKLHSVSCTSTTFCEVGAAVNVFTVDGTSESGPDAIDQSNNETNESGYGLPSMSCPSPTFCGTIDGSGNAFILNGSTWSAPEPIDNNVQLNSVSCVSPEFCVAVDSEGNAFTYKGSAWSAAQSVDPNTALESVSCPSTSFCVAVDSNGDSLVFNGRIWSAPSSIESGHQLAAVSCPTTGFCVVVDVNGNYVVAH